ncbi:xylan glycosyltransferase MUCI21-like [Macadamia integrifolia]|uniref:xylan glycosyltransferase MUCI21-like n=1 Tax=Macadamia integrifolia TaxID=60698 RepID=UPI001C501E2C|nr:xylan glycosyltransferase MUCI21-like [Macadamia integrifolia]
MGKHHRYYQPRKGEENGDYDKDYSATLLLELGTTNYYKRTKPKVLPLPFLFSLVSCSLILVPQLFSYSATLSLIYSFRLVNDEPTSNKLTEAFPSSTFDEGLMCDRGAFRYDICFMRGDIRTLSLASTIINYLPYENDYEPPPFFDEDAGIGGGEEEELQHEKIKPYTRKWETSVMDTIPDVELIVKKDYLTRRHVCDVHHSVPAVIFSTGGYTGNVYHEFSDGIIPLYITTQHLKKKVVFVVADYRRWWYTKYADILSLLSDYPPIDFNKDPKTHCFPEAIIGLKIHDDLSVNSSFVPGNKGIKDFRNLLDRAYWPRIRMLMQEEEREAQLKLANRSALSALPLEEVQKPKKWKPKLVIISRKGTRVITNQAALVKSAEEIGFQVEILLPTSTTELAKIYRVLNSSDVLIGVHGAGLTHLLFMRPGTVFIQVIPLGTDWAANTYYGAPAIELGLNYMGYEIFPKESSLSSKYEENHRVLTDPHSVNKMGWELTKKIYLDGQNVILNIRRFRKHLLCAYEYSIAKRNQIQAKMETIENTKASAVS